MSRRRFTFYLAFSTMALSGAAHSTTDRCLGALVADHSFSSSDTVTALALTSLINQESATAQQGNHDGEVTLGGTKLHAAGSEAKSAYDAFRAQTDLNWNAAARTTLITSRLGQAAVAAYKVCEQGQVASGPRVDISDATATQATVTVSWNAPPLAPTRAVGSVTVTGGQLTSPMPIRFVTGQRVSRTVKRAPGQDLRVNVDIGSMSDAETLVWVPEVSAVHVVEPQVFPPSGPAIKLDNDGTGANRGPIQGCFHPVNSLERAGSAKVLFEAHGGALDSSSYVRIVSEEPGRVCYEAFLRPLSKEGGGVMAFRIAMMTDRWVFTTR